MYFPRANGRPLLPPPPYDREAAAAAFVHLVCERGIPLYPEVIWGAKPDGRIWIAITFQMVVVMGHRGGLTGGLQLTVPLPRGSHCTVAVLPPDTPRRFRNDAIFAAVRRLTHMVEDGRYSWRGTFGVHPASPGPGTERTPFLMVVNGSSLHRRLSSLSEVIFAHAELTPRVPWLPGDYHLRLAMH